VPVINDIIKKEKDLNLDLDESLENTYVTVHIGEELYGIEVKRVKEVIGVPEIVHVPNSVNYMKGVINLRGKIIPILNMRLKFGLEEKSNTKLTVIVIIKIFNKLLGLLVDSISDVVEMTISQIQDTPHFCSSIEVDCIKGIGKIDEKIIVIMNVSNIFTGQELENITQE
jgi:purine-binding chemotaxis protein CheW